jgi:hypothetical protein
MSSRSELVRSLNSATQNPCAGPTWYSSRFTRACGTGRQPAQSLTRDDQGLLLRLTQKPKVTQLDPRLRRS